MPDRNKVDSKVHGAQSKINGSGSKLATSLSKMGVELLKPLPSTLRHFKIDVNSLSKEQIMVIRRGQRAGLLLSDGQLIAWQMGEELMQQLMVRSNMDDLIQATCKLLLEDFRKRNFNQD